MRRPDGDAARKEHPFKGKGIIVKTGKLLALAIAAFAVALSACEQKQTADGKGPAEQAGKQIDQAAAQAGKELNKAGEAAGEGLQRLGQKLQGQAQNAEKKDRQADR